MSEVKVSIIVPFFNSEKRLDACLNSLISQTFTDIEIILINDGSTDGSSDIAQKYVKSDKRVRLIYQHNKGVSSARNAGLDNATGEFIAFVDSDDYLELNYIEILLKYATEYNSDITACSLVTNTFEDGSDTFINETYNAIFNNDDLIIMNNDNVRDMFANKYITGMFNTPCCKLYKRENIEKMGLRFDITISLGEDLLFNLPLFKSIKTFVYIEKPLYHYVNHSFNSLSKKYIPNLIKIKLRLHQAVLEQLIFWNIYDDNHKAKIMAVLFQDVLTCISTITYYDSKLSIFNKFIDLWHLTGIDEVREMVRLELPWAISKKKLILLLLKYRVVPLLYILGVRSRLQRSNKK